MLLTLLKKPSMSKEEDRFRHEPYGIKFSRTAYVSGIPYPSMSDVTLPGDVYIKDDGKRNMQNILSCYKIYNSGRAHLDNDQI